MPRGLIGKTIFVFFMLFIIRYQKKAYILFCKTQHKGTVRCWIDQVRIGFFELKRAQQGSSLLPKRDIEDKRLT